MRAQELIDEEYESVCDYMASCGRLGMPGDKLPMGISVACLSLINQDIYAFQSRIRDCAYAYAMEHR